MRRAVVCVLIALGVNIAAAFADTGKAREAFKSGNYVEAEREARAAIASGDFRGYEVLAGLMMARKDRLPDIDGAIAVLQEARHAGWLRANVILAALLRNLGRSSGKFAGDESFALLKEAADQGFPPAQYFVAKDYELLFMAYGRPDDRVAALHWFRKAAQSPRSTEMEQARVMGQQIYCEVGWRIENNLHSAVDALPWYRHCAEVGCREGMEKLAEIYQAGSHGAKVDSVAARRWKESAKMAKPDGCSLD